MNIRARDHEAAPVGTALGPGSATVIAGYGLAIAKALEHYGVDSRRVLTAAGIGESLYNDPLERLPVATITRLYDICTHTTGDPYFGLTVATCMQVSTLHALGFGLLASTSLMDFCARVQRYFRLVSQSARIEIVMRGAEVHFRSVPLVAVSAQTQDAWLGMMYRLMRMLYREDFRPLAVELVHAMPDPGDDIYVRFFGAPVRFDRDAATLILSRADMDVALHSACPELAQLNDNLAASYIAKLDRSDTIANVRARIVELLPSGKCSRSDVATALCMSTSGLQQQLMKRDTSFQALLDDIRRELACGYLRQSGVSVTEITFLLGFSDVSNFTRAFKRWTGTSPTRFRASLRTMSA